uniref:Uncharacterized protein n=1 Tax=Nelumbo nucifera TaxID=4432 RepID=A0A822XQQ7_NELNU|nr:TPA_asm: hypothetical protein HUJ06_021271 [Nelumbo nucifera]
MQTNIWQVESFILQFDALVQRFHNPYHVRYINSWSKFCNQHLVQLFPCCIWIT